MKSNLTHWPFIIFNFLLIVASFIILIIYVEKFNHTNTLSIKGSPGGIAYAETSKTLGITETGHIGQVLTSNGSDKPYWGPNGGGISITGSPGGVAYADTTTTLAVTTSGTSGQVLTSDGSNKPYWSSNSSGVSVPVGPVGSIVRSNGTNWIASSATFADTYTANSILFANGSNTVTATSDFLWNETAQNLQLGTTGVSIGINAGVGTSSIAIGDSAGQITQQPNCVAIGQFAGQTGQGTAAGGGGTAIAVGLSAGALTQSGQTVAIGSHAGQVSQGGINVAIGLSAGQFTQDIRTVAIGGFAGYSSQNNSSVAIGFQAGQTFQGFSTFDSPGSCVAIGTNAGNISQGNGSVAIGVSAGQTNQGFSGTVGAAIAIGQLAGQNRQGNAGIAIGQSAGQNGQESYAVALGAYAGQNTQTSQSIVLNASGVAFDAPAAGFYVNPVRSSPVGGSAPVLSLGTGNEICVNSSKTFIIPHPLYPNTHYLQHACLEGPEAGVYYRGQGEIPVGVSQVTIYLPEYVSKLGRKFTVHLTPKDDNCFLAASAVKSNGSFRVMNQKFSFLSKMVNPYGQHQNCYGSNKKSCKFFWTVVGERVPIQPEICKTDVKVRGNGPYTWIENIQKTKSTDEPDIDFPTHSISSQFSYDTDNSVNEYLVE
jgi:hypothetical protein